MEISLSPFHRVRIPGRKRQMSSALSVSLQSVLSLGKDCLTRYWGAESTAKSNSRRRMKVPNGSDEICLFLLVININILMQQVNIEFQKIVTFFRSLKLALHPAKTKFMIFSNSNQIKSNPWILL